MQLSDFDYSLPPELISAFPPSDRPSAKLLRANRETGEFSHHIFRDMVNFFRPGDVLVLNNTKVIPARIFGKKETGGIVEGLLLKQHDPRRWSVLLRPAKRIRQGMTITFGENGTALAARVLDPPKPHSGERLVEFSGGNIRASLEQIGHIPLPPYIDRPDSALDRERYQTVFAKKEGAVASPTAGLHFDRALLGAIRNRDVEIAEITLHVSYGTFRPIVVHDLSKHEMFEEEFEIEESAADIISLALSEKRRVIACGTTTVRCLESAAGKKGRVRAQKGRTTLFIRPPYEFKVISGLITNFHLPKSTLLLLVAAFLGGPEPLLRIYREAIAERYRFYSYGDAMVIL